MDPIEYDSNQQTIDAVNLLKTAILQSQARAAKCQVFEVLVRPI